MRASFERGDETIAVNEMPIDPRASRVLKVIHNNKGVIVYKAKCLLDSSIVAIKTLDLGVCQERFRYQIPTIYHKNLLKPFCSFIVYNHLWVVMPFMAGGSLRAILSSSQKDGIDERWMKLFLKESLKAISFLHSEGLIHGDIKASNILLDSEGCVKVSDYKVSASYYQKETSDSANFNEHYSKSDDIWCLGFTALVCTYKPSTTFLEILKLFRGTGHDSELEVSAANILENPYFTE